MEKQRFTATFSGHCYIKSYGRKFYKKGYSLTDIRDEQGNQIPDQKISLIKAFDIIKDKTISHKVEFMAKFDGDKILYISDVKITQ